MGEAGPQSGGLLGGTDAVVVPSSTLLMIHPPQETDTVHFYS